MNYKKMIIMTAVVLVMVFGIFGIVLTRDSGHVHGEQLGQGHSHDHTEEGKSSQITVWDDRFEIFLEHPFVLIDTPTEFVTHVTDRVTLKPRREGPVVFVLTDESGMSTRHVEEAPARDGIYIPELTFAKSGKWQVSLVIPLEKEEYVIELPVLTVYQTQDDIFHAPSPEDITGISFLKEQQWEVPFKTELVRRQKVLSQTVTAVPESAVFDEEGKPVAFVQMAGETFEKRYLELGNKDNGLVEVLSGLSEGEYVTTKGAHAIARAEHGEESLVNLSKEQISKFGIMVAEAGSGEFEVKLSVPGEITFNDNKLAHIVPTVPGIVREVIRNVGDNVKAGEVIAWLESTKLGGAKVQYMARKSEVSCCSIELVRAQEVYDNTMKLLETLKSSPSSAPWRRLGWSAIS